MILLRIILFSLIFILGKSQDLQLVGATSQTWSGGAPGSPVGIRYSIRLVTKKASTDLKAEGLWIGEEYFPAILSGKKRESNFSARDTVYLLASHMGKLREDDTPTNRIEKPSVPLPFKYKGGALIQYRVNKKIKYLIVPAFEQLKPLMYP